MQAFKQFKLLQKKKSAVNIFILEFEFSGQFILCLLQLLSLFNMFLLDIMDLCLYCL